MSDIYVQNLYDAVIDRFASFIQKHHFEVRIEDSNVKLISPNYSHIEIWLFDEALLHE